MSRPSKSRSFDNLPTKAVRPNTRASAYVVFVNLRNQRREAGITPHLKSAPPEYDRRRYAARKNVITQFGPDDESNVSIRCLEDGSRSA